MVTVSLSAACAHPELLHLFTHCCSSTDFHFEFSSVPCISLILCIALTPQALDAGDCMLAIGCLRQDLAPLNIEQQRLQHLAGCIMCSGKEDLRAHTAWPGPSGGSRHQLLKSL